MENKNIGNKNLWQRKKKEYMKNYYYKKKLNDLINYVEKLENLFLNK